MTISEWAQTAWMAGKAAIIWIALAILVLLLILFAQCHGRRVAEDALARQTEEAAAERAGLEVVHAATEKELKARLDGVLAGMVPGQQAAFSAQLDATRHILSGAHLASVITASTGPRPVQPAQGAAPHPPGAAPACPACALLETDEGRIDVTQVTVESSRGTKVLVGCAEVYRVGKPDRHLFGGVFTAPLTEAAGVQPPAPIKHGWRIGPLVGISDQGMNVGGAVLPPELLGLQGFGTIAAGNGHGALSIGVVF